MSTVKTGNSAHDATVNLAEALRQASITPSSTAAQIKTAETTFYRTALASALSNGVNPVPFITALRDLLGPGQYV